MPCLYVFDLSTNGIVTVKYKNKYRTLSSRLKSWDYSQNGSYFITICTKNKSCVLGQINDGEMQLSKIGVLADVFLYEIKNHTKNIEVGPFVVMPNHIHVILSIDNGTNINGRDKACLVPTCLQKSMGQQRFQNQGKNTISSIIGSYKSAVTKHAHRLGHEFTWQPRFHDHIIRNQESLNQITEYINNNPENWGKDKFHPEQLA